MNIFQQQTMRKKGSSILLGLLLSLAVFLSSLCVATRNTVSNHFASLEQGYMTVAVHAGENIEKLVYTHTEEHIEESDIKMIDWLEDKVFYGQDSCAFPDGSQYSGPIDVTSAAPASSYVLEIDQRLLLSAHVAEMIPLSSGRVDELAYIPEMDAYCHNASVAALECVEVALDEVSLTVPDNPNIDWTGDTPPRIPYTRTITFRIVDWVSRSDAYDLPPEAMLST